MILEPRGPGAPRLPEHPSGEQLRRQERRGLRALEGRRDEAERLLAGLLKVTGATGAVLADRAGEPVAWTGDAPLELVRSLVAQSFDDLRRLADLLRRHGVLLCHRGRNIEFTPLGVEGMLATVFPDAAPLGVVRREGARVAELLRGMASTPEEHDPRQPGHDAQP